MNTTATLSMGIGETVDDSSHFQDQSCLAMANQYMLGFEAERTRSWAKLKQVNGVWGQEY